MTASVTIPCAHCRRKIDAYGYAQHVQLCGPSKPLTEPHVNCSECHARPALRGDAKGYCVECREVADRFAAQQEQSEREGEFGPRARTPYEVRIAREQTHRDAMPFTKKAGG